MTYKLGLKVSNPCTKKQFEYLQSFNNVVIAVPENRVLNRLSIKDASELIQRAKNGEEIIIEQQ